jgi:hypothetical protein
MSERISVSVEVINKVLAVLTQMPYQQVAAVVEELRTDVEQIESGEVTELHAAEAG